MCDSLLVIWENMRRSAKQDLLLAVCSKMGEVIPFLTDDECDACIKFLKETHANATRTADSVASPAFQNLSLRELFDEKIVVKAGGEKQREKKVPKLPKPSLSPREPSQRRVRKRALWGEDEGEGEDEGDE